MPRAPRQAPGGIVYHVLNRSVGRRPIFDDGADFAAFVRVLDEAVGKYSTRLLAWCVMSNHWHLVLWPRQDGGLLEPDATDRRWRENAAADGDANAIAGRLATMGQRAANGHGDGATALQRAARPAVWRRELAGQDGVKTRPVFHLRQARKSREKPVVIGALVTVP